MPSLREAQLRHAKHYVIVLRKAQRLYQQGVNNGVMLFNLNWNNIENGLKWTIANMRRYKVAARLCSDYMGEGGDLFAMQRQPNIRIQWMKMALVAAKHLNLRNAESAHLGNIGNAYSILGDIGKALRFNKKALTIHRETGNRRYEVIALGNIGHSYRKLGNYRKAIRFFKKAYKTTREINDGQLQCHALITLGDLYNTMDDTLRAIKCYKRASIIVHDTNDLNTEGLILGSLGVAYNNLGKTRYAIKFYEQSLAIFQKTGNRRRESAVLVNLGNAFLRLKETSRAIELFHKSLIITREFGERLGECLAAASLGNAYYSAEEFHNATKYFEQQLSIARECGYLHEEAGALNNLGSVYADLGETNRAIEFYELSLDIKQKIGDRRGKAKTLSGIGSLYTDFGKYYNAIVSYEQALAIFREINDQRGEGFVLWNMGLVLDKLKDRREAIKCAEAALKILLGIEDPKADEVQIQLTEWRREDIKVRFVNHKEAQFNHTNQSEREAAMNRSCDLCGTIVKHLDQIHEVSSEEMQKLVSRGFSMLKLSSGPVAQLMQSNIANEAQLKNIEATWVHKVMTDKSSWFCCSKCFYEAHKIEESNKPVYEFVNPKFFSGFRVELLKYLFVHIPEKDFALAKVSEDFVTVLCDSAGAELKEIFQYAKVSFIKESDAGDIVQRTQKLPNSVYQHIETFYPEVLQDEQRFPIHARVFDSIIEGRLGLIVLVYGALCQ